MMKNSELYEIIGQLYVNMLENKHEADALYERSQNAEDELKKVREENEVLKRQIDFRTEVIRFKEHRIQELEKYVKSMEWDIENHIPSLEALLDDPEEVLDEFLEYGRGGEYCV